MTHAASPPPLSEAEGRALLAIARAAILETVGRPAPPFPEPEAPLPTAPRAVFVTLRVDGRLRGCIGHLQPDEPLPRSVAACARAAAFEDPRFEPLGAAEIPALTLELSVLGTRRTLDDPASLCVGQEGLVVTSGGRSGLLLPQVATEQGWGALEFLEATCQKAGLPRSAWREGARVEAFPAQVFSEPAGRR